MCYLHQSAQRTTPERPVSSSAQRLARKSMQPKNNYIIAGVYADEGISGQEKACPKEKGLLRLLEDIKQDKIDMVLVNQA